MQIGSEHNLKLKTSGSPLSSPFPEELTDHRGRRGKLRRLLQRVTEKRTDSLEDLASVAIEEGMKPKGRWWDRTEQVLHERGCTSRSLESKEG